MTEWCSEVLIKFRVALVSRGKKKLFGCFVRKIEGFLLLYKQIKVPYIRMGIETFPVE